MFTSPKRVCLAKDNQTIVDCDSQAAAFQLVAEGGVIPTHVAEQYGLPALLAVAEAVKAESSEQEAEDQVPPDGGDSKPDVADGAGGDGQPEGEKAEGSEQEAGAEADSAEVASPEDAAAVAEPEQAEQSGEDPVTQKADDAAEVEGKAVAGPPEDKAVAGPPSTKEDDELAKAKAKRQQRNRS